jgi:hypothetical protein
MIRLPMVTSAGTTSKPTQCAGCAKGFTYANPAVHRCDFRIRGFPWPHGAGHARPCGVAYHAYCIQAGPPFRTRLPKDKGLVYPHGRHAVTHFICESCQVRALLNREIQHTKVDVALLMLERMRMIDAAHNLAATTIATYGRSLNRLQRFTAWSGVPTLVPTVLRHPPVSPALGIMYAQLQHSVQPTASGETVTYGVARQLRSAASAYYQNDLAAAYPHQATMEQRRVRVLQHIAPTDSLHFTMQGKGMARRMGTASKPSWALSHVHIAYIDQHLNTAFRRSSDPMDRHELAVAGSVNLWTYLGWLRGGETFGLKRDEVAVLSPQDGPTVGLPLGMGLVTGTLLPETKTDPTQAADVVIAYRCLSGLSLGLWMDRLATFQATAQPLLFSTARKPLWTSLHFRTTYAWPLLEQQRLAGEATLRGFSTVPGHRIRDKIWSMHSWRRGGRSRVSRGPRAGEPRIPGRRKATNTEIVEHGRWRRRMGGEDMPTHYNQWDVVDRAAITTLSM